MSKLFAARRRIVIAGITTAMVLAGGGTAFAYFSATGQGIGGAIVGSEAGWEVSPAATNSGIIYPGSGSTVITFDVTNTSGGVEQFSDPTVTVDEDPTSGDIEEDTPSPDTTVPGCMAGWFNAEVLDDPHDGENVDPGNTVQVTVKVTLANDLTDDQDACQGADPDVTLTIPDFSASPTATSS